MQTFPQFKILVINDGSTDSSLERLKTFQDDRIILINQDNKGVSAARNTGLIYAQEHDFEHIFLLDADDHWLPNHIETHLNLSTSFPDAAVFGSNYRIKKNERIQNTKFTGFTNQKNQYLIDFFKFNYLNFTLNCSNISFKSKVLKEVSGFNQAVSHFEDIDFFIRLGIQLKVAFTHFVTVTIDETAENRSDTISMTHRSYPDFNTYETNYPDVVGLKKYLDLNRYAIALQYRLVNNIPKALEFQKAIDLKNLTSKQTLLLKLNSNQLKRLKKTQELFSRWGFRLRSGS